MFCELLSSLSRTSESSVWKEQVKQKQSENGPEFSITNKIVPVFFSERLRKLNLSFLAPTKMATEYYKPIFITIFLDFHVSLDISRKISLKFKQYYAQGLLFFRFQQERIKVTLQGALVGNHLYLVLLMTTHNRDQSHPRQDSYLETNSQEGVLVNNNSKAQYC